MATTKNNTTAQKEHQKLSGERIDALDLLTARHLQVKAVLASLSMSFDSAHSEPTKETVQNTIWAAQEIIEQAQGAVALLD